MGITQLAIASWHYTCLFLAWNFSGLPGSLLSKHNALWFLAVSQSEYATERILVWKLIGHNEEFDNTADSYNKTALTEIFPAMKNCWLSVCSHRRPTLKDFRIGSQKISYSPSQAMVEYFLNKPHIVVLHLSLLTVCSEIPLLPLNAYLDLYWSII